MASSGSIDPVLAAPALAHTAMGLEPRSAVLSHSTRECLHVQTGVWVARNHANAFRSDTDNHCRAAEYAMALVAHIHGRALRVAGRLPGSNEGVKAGRRTLRS